MRPRAWLAPVAGALGGYAIAGPWGALAGVGVGVVVKRLGPRRGRGRSAALRDEQVADAVTALASAMRSGLSLTQAIAYAAEEADEPLGGHLAGVAHAIEVGQELDVALDVFSRDVGTDDARLVVATLSMHRRTGGDLPIVLDQVASTVRERLAVAREVRALTAQARLSGLILGLLPIGFFGFLWLTSRRDIESALSTTAGLGSVGLGIVLEAGAFVWIRRLLVVE
ncbi:MAG: type II secretion system F family protein [Actinomycetota bacterium]